MGIYLVLRALAYKLAVKALLVPRDIMMPTIIGMKRLMEEVVSSMITSKEYVSPVYPASMEPAPTKTGVTELCLLLS